MFYDQLKKLCDESSVSLTALTEKLGMSKGSVTNWKKGGVPNGDALVRFSKHFNVSTDYLLLGSEALEKSADKNSQRLSAEEQELVENYRKLDNRRRHHLQLLAYNEVDEMDKERRLKAGESFESVFGPSEENPRPNRPPQTERPARIPFAAMGGENITPEQDEFIQERLRAWEERSRKFIEGKE